MKKILIILLSGIVLTACSNDDNVSQQQSTESNSEEEINQLEQTSMENKEDNATQKEPDKESKDDDKEYYYVGDTAHFEESVMINQPYTLTVNDFAITREFEGEPMEEYLIGFEEDSAFYLAIVNVTVTNNGSETFKFEENSNISLLEYEREGFNYMLEGAIAEELATDIKPSESLTLDLPFIVNTDDSQGTYYMYIDPPGSVFQKVYELVE
ncbi:DUF4352 domain-containing protein [Virgibacillus ainsalahensis]